MWIEVCHPCNLSIKDYHRHRQFISRLPYTQSPWGPITSSKRIVEISAQLQIELGREYLYTLFSFSPFSFEIENKLESLWSDIIDLHNIFFFFWLCNVNVHFSNIKPLIWLAPPEHCRGWKPFLYMGLLCWEEDFSSLEEVGNIASESSFESSSA